MVHSQQATMQNCLCRGGCSAQRSFRSTEHCTCSPASAERRRLYPPALFPPTRTHIHTPLTCLADLTLACAALTRLSWSLEKSAISRSSCCDSNHSQQVFSSSPMLFRSVGCYARSIQVLRGPLPGLLPPFSCSTTNM
jgi:hypothetical protein